MNEETFKDAFNALCGQKIGGGEFRDVFKCRIDPSLVVKVELEKPGDFRSFHNVFEVEFWENVCKIKGIAKWLAPVILYSPDKRVILQKRCEPLRAADLPEKLPEFLTDTKPENFGMLDGRFVCFDYAYQIVHAKTKMRKAKW